MDEDWNLKNDFHQIQRSFHEAAIALALKNGQTAVANQLLTGMAQRLEKVMDAKEAAVAPTPYRSVTRRKDVASGKRD